MEYPEEFQKAVNDLIDNWEGGYVKDSDDPGGETNMGISKRSYPAVDIKNLTRDQAVAIYYRDYWQKPALDVRVKDPDIRAKCFNMGVLMGSFTALALTASCATLDQYRRKCVQHFQSIVTTHPVCAKYLKGWIRRAEA